MIRLAALLLALAALALLAWAATCRPEAVASWDEPDDGLPPFDPRTWQDVTGTGGAMARWVQ